ncbi:MAG: TetR/AcrR family transcriptional regulator [Actinobacteria bacterium]|nr:MAG: TetR/AcrR family transcriptional regulator [Actinomycetota bacterium]
MPGTAATVGLRERHKHQRRERILEAIRELLRARPNETPTVERIAEVADVSPATVFNLVGPREQQWAALYDALLRELDARLAITADEDPRKHARRLVGEAAQLFIADAAVFRHIVNNSGRSGSLVQENPIPLLRAALRRGQETGMLRPDLHIDALAGHIAMACGGALRQWASERISAAAFRERVRFAVDVVFAASASDDHAAALHAPLERASRRRAR